MTASSRSLALVTGAASGLGFELAKCCAENGFDLVVAAEEPEIHLAAQTFRDLGAMVLAVHADLSTLEGVDRLWAEVESTGQPVEMLLAAADRGQPGAFLGQEFGTVRHRIDTHLMGMLSLLHKVGAAMRSRGRGRILIAGQALPAPHAVEHGIRAFHDSFAAALRDEMKDSGVTIVFLAPHGEAADAARQGFDEIMREDDASAAWRDKLRGAPPPVSPGLAETRHSH